MRNTYIYPPHPSMRIIGEGGGLPLLTGEGGRARWVRCTGFGERLWAS